MKSHAPSYLNLFKTNKLKNIMGQYHPSYNARKYPDLSRRIIHDKYLKAVDLAKKAGMYRFDKE